MSRIGRKPITVPKGVKVTLNINLVVVEGPLGRLEAVVPLGVTLRQEGDIITVGAPEQNRSNRGFQGLMRALLQNMIDGVQRGYEKSLEINGVGYKAELKGSELVISAGYSHQVRLKVPKGITATVDKSLTKVVIKGIDIALVGLFAAKIYDVKKPEPYKGKGIKYAGQVIRRKAGKTGAK